MLVLSTLGNKNSNEHEEAGVGENIEHSNDKVGSRAICILYPELVELKKMEVRAAKQSTTLTLLYKCGIYRRDYACC